MRTFETAEVEEEPEPVRPRPWRRPAVTTAAVVLTLAVVVVAVPLPFLDAYIAGEITERVAAQVSCPGAGTRPRVEVRGGRLLPQALRRTVTELRLTVPDVAVGGARRATFAATLRDVSQPAEGVTRVGRMDASITIGFADIPTTPGEPPATFGRADDGSLTVATVSTAESAKNVTATLYLRMELRGESVAAVPQRLELFGLTLPAEQVAELTGGVRTQPLPDLPDGVAYRSVTPEADGLHVALDGVATERLADLPSDVDGRPVTYRAVNGLLGISTAIDLPALPDIPLTIFAAPRLDGGTLVLEPRSVDILGADRPPEDLLARLVLGQISAESLSRELPALPAGVRYRSVGVDDTGVKVALGGVTVKPYSELSTGDGRPTTFGARDGLLTATTKGGKPDGSPTDVVLFARPAVNGSTLDLAPQQIQMYGVRFPAEPVLAQIQPRRTAFPLPELPARLTYRGAEVVPEGLRITMSGTGVALRKGQLTGGC